MQVTWLILPVLNGWVRNSVLKKFGVPPALPYPAEVRLDFGNGRRSEMRYDANIPVGIGGGRCKFTASLMDADIPACLRKGELGAKWIFSRCLAIG